MKTTYMRIVPMALLIVCLMGPHALHAQEVLYTPSATSPGKGITSIRTVAAYESYDGQRADGPFKLDQYTVETILAHGITADLTLMMHLPVTYRDFSEPATSNSESFGLEDIRTMFKYRFYQDDIGNIDTVRMSAMVGIELPSYWDGFSSDSFDPFAGVALTAIQGRHGVGAHAMYQWNTGDDPTGIEFSDSEADAVRLDGSYLYRIDPDEYTIDTTKSTYLTLEFNNRYETNGDFEALIGPGILIEATNWAAEMAVRFPIAQEIDNRAELNWSLTFGLRFTF